MFTYKTLEGTGVEVLREVFEDAFSDYQVKMELPLWKFQQMLQRRGFAPEISLGAYHKDRLVGFVLNGLRVWNGKPTVYDMGTGVIGEYRKQGITSSMLMALKSLLKEKRVDQYLLEVLQVNTPAVELNK